MFEEITAPDMMADNPKYHITWGDSPFQVEGKPGRVRFLFASIGDIVLWNSGDKIAVADWGIADEMWFHQMSTGAELRRSATRSRRTTGSTSCRAARRSSGPTTTARC